MQPARNLRTTLQIKEQTMTFKSPYSHDFKATIEPQPPVWSITIGKKSYRFQEVGRLDFVFKLQEIDIQGVARTLLVGWDRAGVFSEAFNSIVRTPEIREITILGGHPDFVAQIINPNKDEEVKLA
jgi:hypothetical protein